MDQGLILSQILLTNSRETKSSISPEGQTGVKLWEGFGHLSYFQPEGKQLLSRSIMVVIVHC